MDDFSALLDEKPTVAELSKYGIGVGVDPEMMGVRLGLADGGPEIAQRFDGIIQQNINPVNKLTEVYELWLMFESNPTRKRVMEELEGLNYEAATRYKNALENGEIRVHPQPDPQPDLQPDPVAQPDSVTQPDTQPDNPDFACRAWVRAKAKKWWGKCSWHDRFNYAISALFLTIFISCTITIATIGSLQSDITRNFFNNSVLLDCYLFTTCDGVPCNFKLDPSDNSCGAAWVVYSLLAVVALSFAVASIAKTFSNKCTNLTNVPWWYLAIEMTTVFISLLLSFSMSVTLSLGHVATCRSIEKHNGHQGCEGLFPKSDFYYASRAGVVEGSAWCTFICFGVTSIIFIFRLIIFINLNRQKAQTNQDSIDHHLPHDQVQESPVHDIPIQVLQAKPELVDLMNLLHKTAPKYYDIGVHLNVDMTTLGLDPHDTHDKNLSLTLNEWMKFGNNRRSPVTWENIISVINKFISNEIAEDMRRFLQNYQCYPNSDNYVA